MYYSGCYYRQLKWNKGLDHIIKGMGNNGKKLSRSRSLSVGLALGLIKRRLVKMVSTGRLERHLPTFYKWGRAIKALAVGGPKANLDIERMGVGKFRVNRVPISELLAGQHLIDPMPLDIERNSSGKFRINSNGGGLDKDYFYGIKKANVDELLRAAAKKYEKISISDADQIDIPKRFNSKEAKEWKNVGSWYSSPAALYQKLIDLFRKMFG